MISGSTLSADLPAGLRDPLLNEYRGIVSAYQESRWKLSSLDAGRFCEVVYTILDGALSGNFASAPSKPNRFPDACRSLESRPPITVGDRSIRILIPRVLPGMYEIRNNRDVGHVGGEVSANQMDATFLRDSSTWVMGGLIRIFHNVSVQEAQATVNALAERRVPLVWEHNGSKRVLAPQMKSKDKVLTLLHASPAGESTQDLQTWVKYKSNFRQQVLEQLEDALMIEVDLLGNRAVITPLGSKYVEEQILKSSL